MRFQTEKADFDSKLFKADVDGTNNERSSIKEKVRYRKSLMSTLWVLIFQNKTKLSI